MVVEEFDVGPFEDGTAESASEVGEVEGLAEWEDARGGGWHFFWSEIGNRRVERKETRTDVGGGDDGRDDWDSAGLEA